MKTTPTLIFCCDLDGTLLPNGLESLSESALSDFQRFALQERLVLVYLSGRSLPQAINGIRKFGVPLPDVYVGDNGTSMYFKSTDGYLEHVEWKKAIASDWGNVTGRDIHATMKDLTLLVEQEPEHQGMFKQSYYFPKAKESIIVEDIAKRLQKLKINATVVTLIDPSSPNAYLDILPTTGTKEYAIEYLRHYFMFDKEDVIFAGDGGNDLGALTSGYRAIVVNNAASDFKIKVGRIAREKGILANVYFAKGNFIGTDGKYLAGIMEGLHHYDVLNQTH